MNIVNQILNDPVFFYTVIVLLSLAVGSFLNVVIYRLPLILEKQWKNECAEFFPAVSKSGAQDNSLEIIPVDDSGGLDANNLGLAFPGSHCPSCGHRITAIENIPLLSYLFLKGKCSSCHTRIPVRYPLVELFTAIVSVIIAWKFGASWLTLFALIFCWSLIALSVIDIDHQFLPDNIIFPVMWTGILLNTIPMFTDLYSSVLGAIAGYLSLWTVYKIFKLATGKEGMGYGDFKLLAMLGAWMGWQSLPLIIVLSAVCGSIIGISMIYFLGREKQIPIPFGPYLAIAGFISLMWGHDITNAYLQWASI